MCGVGVGRSGGGRKNRVQLKGGDGIEVDGYVGNVIEIIMVAYWKEARAPPTLASLPFFVVGLYSGI